MILRNKFVLAYADFCGIVQLKDILECDRYELRFRLCHL